MSLFYDRVLTLCHPRDNRLQTQDEWVGGKKLCCLETLRVIRNHAK